MDGLRVPYGVSEARDLIAVKEAVAGAEYFCPACSEKLILRAGSFRVKHFSHPSHSNCSQETILHKTAKFIVQQAIQENAAGGRTIRLQNQCRNCGKDHPAELL